MKNNRKYKSRNKKLLKFVSLIFITILFFCFQTIVYSAFSSTMIITGDAYARTEVDVRITGFRIASTNNATSHYEEFGKSHVVTEVDLVNSSSSITYYLEITNYGSVDVGIFDITGLPSGVNYSIKDYNLQDKICDDYGECNSFIIKTYELTISSNSAYAGTVQMNFDFRTYHKVTYTDITNNGYPIEVIDGGSLNIRFKEDLKRVQVFSNETEISYYKQISKGQRISINNIFSDVEFKFKEQVARLSNGNINEVGSEICIEDECFYIISNDGSTVTMLAKYNLYVGNECTSASTSSCTAYGEEATGKQDLNMIGFKSGESVRKGTTKFSSTNYWSSTVSSYPAYVYDSNSILYNYVENYKTYLSTLGVTPSEARLITYEELINLGCSASVCNSAPSWVYATSYWSGSARSSSGVLILGSNGFTDNAGTSSLYNFGCRPVIELDVDEIRTLVRVVSGNGSNVGDEICIADECFYTISSDSDSITMLAKYNLNVGKSVVENNDFDDCIVAPLENPTGKQDRMSGWLGVDLNGNDIYPIIGATEFSTNNYWTSTVSGYPAYVYNNKSTVYNYVENYKTYLESLGSSILESRLITYEELLTLGCDDLCLTAPNWVYSTTYWTGTAEWDDSIMGVDVLGNYGSAGYDTATSGMGVRPVITISKSEF